MAQGVTSALERGGYDRRRISVLAADPRGEIAKTSRNGGVPGAAAALAPLEIPGVGPATVSGPLSAFLAERNGASTGLVGSLTQVGFAGPDATHYLESLRRGQVVMAVESPEAQARQTEEALRRLGARAVTQTSSIAAPDSSAFGTPAPVKEGVRDQVTLPVVEEQLEVGKRQVNRGGVRIHSHIVEQPIEEQVHLREERVSVERRPVSREATDEDLAEFKEGSIEIHETVEEVVVSKRRRVVEEIVIGRETRERTETVHETVRKTQVDVEPLEGSEATGRPPAGVAHEAVGQDADEYGPAYRYGFALAGDERYRDADWQDVEPHARRAWEEQNPGTWEQFKDGVRNAWDRLRRR